MHFNKQSFLMLALVLGLSGLSSMALAEKVYTHWTELPPGAIRSLFETKGSKLINNLNIVALENNQPVLIRGGGFSKAGLDWLVHQMGVRTVIDLRGRFSDDKTDQMIALSPGILADYTRRHQQDQLRNLSPEKAQAYLENLAQKEHLPIQYLNLKAEDPRIVSYLEQANPQKPLAMFCQWGVNRSGSAWGVYAAHQGWSLEKAFDTFGVKGPQGTYRNKRDIAYGYNLEQARLKRHK